REDRVRGPARLPLNREGHAEAARRGGLAVVPADLLVLRPDDEAGVVEARVSQAREGGGQEPAAAAQGDHRPPAAARGLPLLRGEARAGVLAAHAGPEPPRQDHRLASRCRHDSREAQSAGTRRSSQTPLTRKTAIQAAAWAVLP